MMDFVQDTVSEKITYYWALKQVGMGHFMWRPRLNGMEEFHSGRCSGTSTDDKKNKEFVKVLHFKM